MKILWLNCRLLHPLIGGDRIRTYEMLRELRRDHEITYLCLQVDSDDPKAAELSKEYADHLEEVRHWDYRNKNWKSYLRLIWEALFSRTPLISTKYDSPDTRHRLQQLVRENEYDLLVCDYLAPLVNLLGIERSLNLPIVLFHHNVESLIWRRHVENARDPLRKFLFWLQWKRTHRFEDVCDATVDAHITVSEVENAYFAEERRFRCVLGAVPTGVDFEKFAPKHTRPEPTTLAFLGAMDWHANVDAVTWFTEEILPPIRESFPDVRFLIIGRNPTTRILSLAQNDPCIEVSGTVPDVTPWLHRASIMVLPLRVGGGTRIKVYEGIAAGVPLVSTSVGVEGLDLHSPEHFRCTDTGEAMARDVIELLENPEKAQAMARSGLNHIQSKYSWNAVCQQFTGLVEKAIKSNEKK